MRNNKKTSCLIVIMSLVLAHIATPTAPTYAEAPMNEENSNHSVKLSDYDCTVHITDKEMIMDIVEDYGLQPNGDIEEIIYVPIPEDTFADNESGIATAGFEWGDEEYYIKKIDMFEKQGKLLRSSWYEYPGGQMEISQSINITYTISSDKSLAISNDLLEAQLGYTYGIDFTESYEIGERQDVIVKEGFKRNVQAYQNNMVYEFELWEEDLIKDDYIGPGTIYEPIGVIFCIGGNIPLYT